MVAVYKVIKNKISSEQLFMISVLIVNAGNYLYNLILGRVLGPEKFADAAILITFLLILSFIGMTFQLVAAKFSVLFEKELFTGFISKIYKQAALFGVCLGILIICTSSLLQVFFNTATSKMFVFFGLGVPFYFLMSVNRGVYQGRNKLTLLSVTYQLEMLSRLFITVGLIYCLNINSSVIIAIGIFFSLVIGLLPFKIENISFKKWFKIPIEKKKLIQRFFIVTAFYECTQIIINNSDILLVKHYFDAYNAGLYASLALIGRVVYFMAWMFVMLLLPKVVALKKEGKDTRIIFFKYVAYIATLAIVIIVGCYLFPKFIVGLLFGKAYLSIVPLLWKYALATGIFAVSNIFAYYFLSIDKYLPVVLSGVFGVLQVVLVILFHSNLMQVVHMQVVAMAFLLAVQLLFFITSETNSLKTE